MRIRTPSSARAVRAHRGLVGLTVLARSLALCLALVLPLAGCGGGEPAPSAQAPSSPPPPPTPPPSPPAASGPHPILFVTQVPVPQDFTTIGSTFGNHLASPAACGRGGDLWIRYPDGSLKNLTKAAGYGVEGFQGAGAIAVRQPCVHWGGTKAVFAMVVGAVTKQYELGTFFWQLYEVTGLGKDDTPVVTKVPGQPSDVNNVSPFYLSDGSIGFTSDRSRTGAAHLYPQLDEYELAPTVTGLWRLDPATGALALLQHAPSGSFTPIVDSAGRIVFTRWDHLQRDQQAESDARGAPYASYGTFNYADESAGAAVLPTNEEVFPEPLRSWRTFIDEHPAFTGDLRGLEPWMEGNSFNVFSPWQLRQDGSEEETLCHVGRQEWGSYVARARRDDPLLTESNGALHPFRPGGLVLGNLFHLREDPGEPGTFYGIDAPEFSTHGSGQIVRMVGPDGAGGEAVTVAYVTHRDTVGTTATPDHSGHYRSPLPLSDGTLVAVHSLFAGEARNLGTRANPASPYAFRLTRIVEGDDGVWTAGLPLTPGIPKAVAWWDPDVLVSHEGPLWELDPVEVVARPAPPMTSAPPVPAPETSSFAEAGVSVAAVKAWLEANDLALIVTRDVTSRDRADRQQPFNLAVAGTGKKTIGASGTQYAVSYLQVFQADQLRGWTGQGGDLPRPGRRVLAVPLHEPAALDANVPPLDGDAPAGSVEVEDDGSVAAVVPARRALTWQLTDEAGSGVVRERYWISFRPGEIRSCASCHGVNVADQAGNPPPVNTPKALTRLLTRLKDQGKVP